ncbi:MAG: metallophosphoesterase [Peptococcaceae bacterium]|nr:metallophosphoesterase [Peptococcaceae bacterium]MBO5302327.1 metallophosphoesterase [Peptococcaceae bacterium]
MLKIFVTGDNHIGKKYDRYPEVKEQLIQSRFDSLDSMVKRAEQEGCALFVITGDLFDNVNTIRQKDIKQVVEILARFSGSVIVLPGNHDYYTGEEKVWKDFSNVLHTMEHNILLMTEMKPISLDAGDESVMLYSAYCQSKHSKDNNLGWMKDMFFVPDVYHIGLAHGAIDGITPDMNNEYFMMTEKELNDIPVDVWLVGHTHIPYPALSTEQEAVGYKIFNPGTHAQTDLHNHTAGYGFVLRLDNQNGKKTVSAKAVQTGLIAFYDISVEVKGGESLKAAIENALSGLQTEAVIRLTVSGAVSSEDYQEKAAIYQKCLAPFLTYEVEDHTLCEIITEEKIRAEFAEISFASSLLENLLDDPKAVQMTYELLKRCQE